MAELGITGLRACVAMAAALAISATAAPYVAAAQEPASIEAIRRVLADYEKGFREGDPDALRRALAEDGRYVFRSRRGGDATIASQTFGELIPMWTSEADPGARVIVQEISITGAETAVVRLILDLSGDAHRDQLNLYRTAGAWRIVAKLSEPAETPSASPGHSR